MLCEITKLLKHALKGKVSFSKSMVIIYMMTGLINVGTLMVAYAETGGKIYDSTSNNVLIGSTDGTTEKKATGNGSNAIAIGGGANANTGAISIGDQSGTTVLNTVGGANGVNSIVLGTGSIDGAVPSRDTRNRLGYILEEITVGNSVNYELRQTGSNIAQTSFANGENSIAIGTKSAAIASGSISLGTSATTVGTDSIAIGTGAITNKAKYLDSEGRQLDFQGRYIDEEGYYIAYNDDGTFYYVNRNGAPVADTAKQKTTSSIFSNAVNQIAIGTRAISSQQDSIAIGTEAKTGSNQGLAIGAVTEARRFNSTAIGNNSLADGYAAIVIGGDDVGNKNQVKNKRDGANTSYAQMVYSPALKENIANPYTLKIERTTHISADGTRTRGWYARLYVWDEATNKEVRLQAGDPRLPEAYRDSYDWGFIAPDSSVKPTTSDFTDTLWDVMGIVDYYKSKGLTGEALFNAVEAFYNPYQEAQSTGVGSIAIGIKTRALTDGSIAMGVSARTEGQESVALGTGTVAFGERAVGVGPLAAAQGNRSVAIGTYDGELSTGDTRYRSAHAVADDTVAIGTGSYADAERSVALGAGSIVSPYTGLVRTDYNPNKLNAPFAYSTTTTAGATGTVVSATVGNISYGNFAGATADSSISIGAGDHERRLQNLAAGEISATSTDAINGSQLHSAVKSIDAAIPMEYRQITDNGNTLPVVQGIDGKYYAVGDINVDGVTYDPTTNTYVNANGDIVNALPADQLTVSIKGGIATSMRNVEDNLPSTYNYDPNNAQTTSQMAPNSVDIGKIKNNVASVNDVLHAGWNLQNNGDAKDFVKTYDVVNFIDGKGTKANVNVREDGLISDVTFNVDNGTISPVSDGTIANTGKVVGASDADKARAAADLARINADLPVAKTALENAKNAFNTAILDLTTKEADLKTAEEQLAEAQGTVSDSLSKVATTKSEISTLDKKIADYDRLLTSTSATTSELAMAQALKDKALADKAAKEAELAINEQAVVDAKADVETKKTNSENAQTARDAAKVVVDNAENDIKTSREALDQLVKEKTEAESINNKVATVENVVDAINNSGWNLTTSASDGTVSGTTTELINPGEVVTFDAGSNITIKQNGNKITIATADNPFEYIVTETAPDGSTTTSTVTKAPNGKVYKTDDVKNAVYNPVTQAYETPAIGADGAPVLNPDGTPVMKTIDPVSDDVANTLTVHTKGDTPQTISNVKSNLPEANKGNAGGTNTGFGGNADGITKNGDAITSVTAPTEEQVKAIANNAASVGDVLNAGWNLQNNGTAKDYVKPYDTVNFIDGVGTTAVVDTATDGLSSTVTFNVNKGKFAVSDGTTTDVNGNTIKNGALVNTGAVDAKQALKAAQDELAAAQTAGDQNAINTAQAKVDAATKAVQQVGDTVATVDNVVNAINQSGWKLTTSQSAGGTATGTSEELINPGETITIDAGKNIAITQATNKITIATKDEVEFTKVTSTDGAGNKTTVTGNGITINGKNADNTDKAPVSLTKDGLNNGGNKITNVAPGTDAMDAVNVSQLKDTVGSAVSNSPFEYATKDGDPVVVGKDGKKYNPADLENATYDPTNGNYKLADGTVLAPIADSDVVIRAKGIDSQTVTNVKSNLPEANNGNAGGTNTGFDGTEGSITKQGDVITSVKAPTATELQNIANNAASVGDVLNAGWNLQNNGTAKDFVKPYDTVNFIDGVGTTAVVETAADGLSSTVTFNVNKGKFAVSDGNTTDVNGNTIKNGALVNTGAVDAKQALKAAQDELAAAQTAGDQNAINTAQAKVDAATKAVQQVGDTVATVDNVVNAINQSGWKLTTSQSAGGTATGTSEELINPGETITIDAGKNIAITQATNKITIATKDEVEFTKVTSTDGAGNTTVLGPTGTTTTDVAGNKNVSNATGNTITDVAGNTTNVTGDGITIIGKKDDGTAKNPVSLTSNGLDNGNNKITNVAAGTDATDAVNVSQLKDTVGEAVSNNPFEYTTKTGDPVTVGKDGNMYNPANLADATYDETTKTYTKPDGTTVTPIDKQDVVINAKGDTPQTITNVKSNLPEANNDNAGGTNTGFGGNAAGITKNGDVITSVTAPTEEQVKSMANNAASVGDVLNAGWNLQNNGTAKDYVKPYDTVNFIDGVGTTAVVETAADGLSSTVTFNINKGKIGVSDGTITDGSLNGNGAANNPIANGSLVNADKVDAIKALKDAQDELAAANDPEAIKKAQDKVDAANKAIQEAGNALATVDNVVNAINQSGWTMTTSKSAGDVSGTTAELINPGEIVTFDAGSNITIKQNGNKITIATADNPFEYIVTETAPDGSTTTSPVIKAPNGKVYKTGDIKNAVYNPDTQNYEVTTITPDGNKIVTVVDPVSDDVADTLTVNAKGDTPQTITNVKSNLPEANNGNAGGTTTGFGGNAVGITKNGDVITGVAAPTDEQVKSIANNAASVGDVLNAGWNLQNNGTAKDYVKPYDTVNFIDGVGTKAVVTTADNGLSSTVTFNVDTSSLPGWTLTTSNSAGVVTGTTNEEIKPGETVTIDAGKNIAITQAANKITIATKDEVEFKTVTSTDANGNKTVLGPTGTTTTDAAGNKNVSNATGNTITDVAGNTTNVTGDGITIIGKKDDGTAKNPVSLTSNGLDNGNNKITNVAAGTDATDAVNVSQLKDTVGEAVSNNPFEYTTKTGDPVTVGKDGNMYNPANLADATYDETTKTYTKPDGTTVTPIDKQDVVINAKGDTPQTITNVKSNLPEANNSNAGGTDTGFGGNADGITKNGDAITNVTAPTEEQVKAIANNAASVGDVLNAGWNLQNNGTAKDYVKPYDTVNFIDGVGTKAVVKTADDGLSSTITFDVNTGSMSVTDGMAVNNNASNIENANKELANAKEALATVKADPNATADAIRAAEKEVAEKQAAVDAFDNQVATVKDVVDTINNTYWTATSGQEGTGVVESTTKESVKAGDEVTFKAGNNLKLVQDGKNFTYSLQDSISLTEVKTGKTVMNTSGLQVGDGQGSLTTIGSNGITIGGNDRQSVSLTNTGLDNGGNKIINVAPGEADTDAVNVSQLKDAVGNTNVRINQLSSDIKHVGAKAAALSSLKTIQYDPLEPTQISAGVGYYGGASALAIGVSHYKNESTLFSGGIAFGGSAGEKVMANASVTWKLGHRADETAVKDTYRQGPISSAYVLQDKVDSLMAENTAQKHALASQQEEIDDLKAKLAKVMNQLGV